jgi:hypothetical protein
VDLYNNGFTGGFVIACLFPIINGLIKEKDKLAGAGN